MKIIFYENRNDSEKGWFSFTAHKSKKLSEPLKLFLVEDLPITSDKFFKKSLSFLST